MSYISAAVDVPAQTVTTIEGKPTVGDIQLKAMMSGEAMTVLEITYRAEASTPMHVHGHESMVYVISGQVSMIVGKETFELGPGDTCCHPRGVPHSVRGVIDSRVLEIKSPSVDISTFLGTT